MHDAPITREWIQALGPIVTSLVVSGLWAWLTHLSRLAHELSLEAKRGRGLQALELFKSALTFDAEVRRAAATRKVESLLKLDEQTAILMRVLLDLEKRNDDRMAAVYAWGRETLGGEVLLPESARIAKLEFLAAVNAANRIFLLREMPGSSVDGCSPPRSGG